MCHLYFNDYEYVEKCHKTNSVEKKVRSGDIV
jgi:hypothetical protein